jgi:hypothetical protein
MSEYNPHQVLATLFDELRKLGEVKREIKGQSYRLAEWSLDDRLDVCVYYYDGIVSAVDGMNCVFTLGKTEDRWSHLAGVHEAVMYARINWKEILAEKKQVYSTNPIYSLPDNETIDGLTEDQVSWVAHLSLRKDHLIRSWDEEVSIRKDFDVHKSEYVVKPIPKKFVVKEEPKHSTLYKSEVVHFLVDHVQSALHSDDF